MKVIPCYQASFVLTNAILKIYPIHTQCMGESIIASESIRWKHKTSTPPKHTLLSAGDWRVNISCRHHFLLSSFISFHKCHLITDSIHTQCMVEFRLKCIGLTHKTYIPNTLFQRNIHFYHCLSAGDWSMNILWSHHFLLSHTHKTLSASISPTSPRYQPLSPATPPVSLVYEF